MVFFVGSIFFTSAAALQWLETINADPGPALRRGKLRLVTFEPHRIDWWSSGVQLVGTVYFNVSTFQALQDGLDAGGYDRLVWKPDALGSICFLVSGYLAYVEVSGHALWPRGRRNRHGAAQVAQDPFMGTPTECPTASTRGRHLLRSGQNMRE
jgi:hypothetical protein